MGTKLGRALSMERNHEKSNGFLNDSVATTLVDETGEFILGKDWERATRYGGRDKAISSQSLASISFSVL